ncbi:TetR/AcrR family transcriptional regulator [Amycolatopsis minnesotensis]|uniref:TetR/AcrR family transcriptional regulator n=1 Tax=Amycolatopsis minnesotensis TaxID=337894 RepID=A0ABN2RZW4_9PSEU
MVNTKRARARPGDGAKLREEILRTAERLLAESGTEEALTLRAVAKLASVTTPSVYLHFSGKEALVEAVCLRVWDELGTRIRDACEGTSDPFVTLGQCGRAYIHFALEHPVQYRVLLMRPNDAEAIPPAAEACFRHMVGAVTACVENGVLKGDPETLALGMWSAMHGCASLLIAQPALPWPDDLESFVNHIVRVAGFGSALQSALPGAAVPRSRDLAAGMDGLAKTMRQRGAR